MKNGIENDIEIPKPTQPPGIKLRFSPSEHMPEEEFLRALRQIVREAGGVKIQSIPATNQQTGKFIPDTTDYFLLIASDDFATQEQTKRAIQEKLKEKKLDSYLTKGLSL